MKLPAPPALPVQASKPPSKRGPFQAHPTTNASMFAFTFPMPDVNKTASLILKLVYTSIAHLRESYLGEAGTPYAGCDAYRNGHAAEWAPRAARRLRGNAESWRKQHGRDGGAAGYVHRPGP